MNTGTDEAFNNGFMDVIFPTDVIRVGFWITHGANIQLILKDSNNTNHRARCVGSPHLGSPISVGNRPAL